jgi:mitochondrial translocator assembly and maintenance protein 41
MHVKLRRALLQGLPDHLVARIHNYHRWYLSRTLASPGYAAKEEPAFTDSLVTSPELELYVAKGLGEIVAGPALTQSLKGFLSAGPGKSLAYVLAKLRKRSAGKPLVV